MPTRLLHDRRNDRSLLSARPRRLRRASAASAVAGRRAHRAAVRPQLRGRRARTACCTATPRRRRSCRRSSARRRSPPATCRWSRCTSTARAPACGACCAPSPSAQLPLTIFGVAHGAGAQSRRRRRMPCRRPRDREPRLALDQLPGRRRGGRARAHRARRRHDHAPHRRAARTAGTPDATARTRDGSSSSTAASSTTPTATPTTCRTGRDGRHAARHRSRISSSRTRSTPTTCASRRRRASTAASSSSRICATRSTRCTREGDPRGLDAPKMLSVGLHCRIVGRPGRIAALARFLDYVQRHDDVWVARRIDIARHWIATHPYAAGKKATRRRQAG